MKIMSVRMMCVWCVAWMSWCTQSCGAAGAGTGSNSPHQPADTGQPVRTTPPPPPPPTTATTAGLWGDQVVDVWAVPVVSWSAAEAPSAALPQVTADVSVSVEFRAAGELLVLDLHPTRDLLASTYNDPENGTATGGPSCEYQGLVRGASHSWAAVSLCTGVRGVVVVEGRQLVVEPPLGASALQHPHHLYSASLIKVPHKHCGVKDVGKKGDSVGGLPQPANRVRRATLHGGPVWTNKTTRFIELVVVADSRYYQRFGQEGTMPRIKAIVNIVNAIFRQLGLVVTLTHVEIWKSGDQIEVVEDSSLTLSNFNKYRKKFVKDQPDLPNDNMQLLTIQDFDGNTIGKATVSGMCSHGDSVGVVQDQMEKAEVLVASTMAHEIGHNLGLQHDEDDKDCQCESSNCVMSTSRDSHNLDIRWSSCSQRNLTASLSVFSFDCLKNMPSQLPLGPSCGNGVVEEGEECDCGPPQFCHNPCCRPHNCTLQANATCASGACCDTQTCRPQGILFVCRAAQDECDVPEYCPGSSEFCPSDVIQRDGTYCRGGKGHCYKGECGSHEGRCQAVWGNTAQASSPHCFTQHNLHGDPNGNCGLRDLHTSDYIPCSQEDAMCGSLHCHTDTSVTPIHGIVSYTAWTEKNHDCRTISASRDIPTSYWLSPNGASCSPGKMCVDQRCVNVPASPFVVAFWVLVAVGVVGTFLLWDHIRWWWERRGRACCTIHLPYCACCLDGCCCPCMNRINRLFLSVLPACPTCHKKKSSANSSKREQQEANGAVPSEVSNTDPWEEGDEMLASPTVAFSTHTSQVAMTSILTPHLNTPGHTPSVNFTHSSAHGETPLLDQIKATNSCNSADITTQAVDTPLPSSAFSDDEMLARLSKLSQNLLAISGRDGDSTDALVTQNNLKNLEDKYTYANTVPNSAGGHVYEEDTPRILPVRPAPPPPSQQEPYTPGKPGGASRESPFRLQPVVPPRPEPFVPPRPEFVTSSQPLQDSAPRQEPVVPPRPEHITPLRVEPVVPPRPELLLPLRPEAAVLPAPLQAEARANKPQVPPRP